MHKKAFYIFLSYCTVYGVGVNMGAVLDAYFLSPFGSTVPKKIVLNLKSGNVLVYLTIL